MYILFVLFIRYTDVKRRCPNSPRTPGRPKDSLRPPPGPWRPPRHPIDTTSTTGVPPKRSWGPPGNPDVNLWAPQLPRAAPGAPPMGPRPGSVRVVCENL